MRVIEEIPLENPFNDKKDGRIIGWISGGVASAIACKKALDIWGDRVEFIFCDTSWEHPDTFRFISDYEKTLGVKVKVIKSDRMADPEQVWRKYKGMNFAFGAPCSMVLKKEVRVKEQDLNNDFGQIFGFDYDKKEMKRAVNMLFNNPDLNPIFPLVHFRLDRNAIFQELKYLGIKHPLPYEHFLNNNCIGDYNSPKGGCVQGGIGYWQKIQKLYPHKFDYMANIEHEISIDKGEPVTICKDQRKDTQGNKLFLKPSKDFPDVETIDVIQGKQPITPFECNGFCSTQESMSFN